MTLFMQRLVMIRRSRANFKLLFFGAVMTIFGISLFVIYRPNNIDISRQVRISGRIEFVTIGRGQALIIVDENGNTIASCHLLNCGYPGDVSDRGRIADVLLVDGRIIGIEVDGNVRRNPGQVAETEFRKRLTSYAMIAFGIAVMIGSLILN